MNTKASRGLWSVIGPNAPHNLLVLAAGVATLATVTDAVRAQATTPNIHGMTVAAAMTPAAMLADAVDQANAQYSVIKPELRSDLVLLPLLAKATTPPEAVGTAWRARLVFAEGEAWGAVTTWLMAAPQRELLEGLKQVTTQTEDWRKSHAFGLPYGAEALGAAPGGPALIRAGLYSELGDPPTLAAVNHLYLPRLEVLEIAANAEATRLAQSGDVAGAIDTMLRLAIFGRQMADRAFYVEASWGLACMSRSLERMRDLAFRAMLEQKTVDAERLRGMVNTLNPNGIFDLERLKLPAGHQLAARQVIDRVYEERGQVKPEAFATTMAKVGVSGRPLRTFSEAARWRDAGQGQADWFAATQKLDAVFSEWGGQWRADWFDQRQQSRRTAYEEMDRSKFLAISTTVPDLRAFAFERQVAKVELIGTRTALALAGTSMVNRNLPNVLQAVRPRWIQVLDNDPYFPPDRINQGRQPMRYFVPMRDQPANASGDKVPHQMEVVTATPEGKVNFRLALKDDNFVLYSFGSDNADGVARRIENTSTVVQGADYLIWPPVLSLYRQHLKDLGDLK